MENDDVKYAVALRYDKEVNNAPVVVSKGDDFLAKKIVDIAKKYNIPIVEDEDIAKALMHLNVGGEIPYSLYEAVSMILAYIYRLKADL